jgi:hypothetical protein
LVFKKFSAVGSGDLAIFKALHPSTISLPYLDLLSLNAAKGSLLFISHHLPQILFVGDILSLESGNLSFPAFPDLLSLHFTPLYTSSFLYEPLIVEL